MSAERLYRYTRIHVYRYVRCTSMDITSIKKKKKKKMCAVDDSAILLRDVAIF